MDKTKKYSIICHGGCGSILGFLELPEGRALEGRDQGYTCQPCSRKLSANIANTTPPSELPPGTKVRLEALKAKLGPTQALSARDLDDLIGIMFSTQT